MALTVEDGTGIAGADSFVELAEIASFASARGYTWPNSASESVQEQAARRAADYLRNERRFAYKGTRKTALQTLPYPRTGVVERGGLSISDSVIPWRLKEAQCRLTIRIVAFYTTVGLLDLQPDLARGGRIQSTTVDVISTTYFDDAPSETQLVDIMGVLEPLLKDRMSQDPTAVSYQSESPATPFISDEFNF